MQRLTIKTHRSFQKYNVPHIFILSKGLNAGKPLANPCPNCFVIIPDSSLNKDLLHWICYATWKCGKYIPLLCGSVIPFLHIRDVRNELENALVHVDQHMNKVDNLILQLQNLIVTERHLELQLKLINELKGALSRSIISDFDKKKQ